MNKAGGEFLDEEDLRDRYKNKPLQLENVLQNAKTTIHPTRKCKMYLDFAMTQDVSSGSSTSHEVKRTMVQVEDKFYRPPKTAKPKKKAADTPNPIALTDKQNAKLTALKANIDKELSKCDDMGAEMTANAELAELLPQKVASNNNFNKTQYL